MSPSVYAVVLNHNGAVWLRRCLESLLTSSYPRLQVLLVDNASTDDSVTIARGISSQVRILRKDTNLGFCEGNNAGIAHALERGADYVALLNNDTYVEPDWLNPLVSVGENDQQIGILSPVQLEFDSDAFNSWMTTAVPHLLDELRRGTEPGAWLPVTWVEGSCLVAKRRVFTRIGCLDPIFFAFFEEIDFCRRARAAGFEIALVPSSRIHHYRGGSFGQPGLATHRAFLALRNSMVFNSTDPECSFLRNLANLLRNDATQLKQVILGKERLAVWCRANGAVLARLPQLYRKWRADSNTIRRCRAQATQRMVLQP